MDKFLEQCDLLKPSQDIINPNSPITINNEPVGNKKKKLTSSLKNNLPTERMTGSDGITDEFQEAFKKRLIYDSRDEKKGEYSKIIL